MNPPKRQRRGDAGSPGADKGPPPASAGQAQGTGLGTSAACAEESQPGTKRALPPGEDATMPTARKPARIALGGLTHHNVKQLKLLNTTIFPVSYTEKFYKTVLEVGEFAKLAYYEDVIVGSVCCRVDTDAETSERKLYIMTLGCLAPYRRMGVGSKMLEHILEEAAKDATLACIYLHVQINNDSAKAFYDRAGFNVKETIAGYYQKIEPADAYVLEKKLEHKATEATEEAKAE